MDLQSQQEKAPRVLLGSAMTRLLRIRSLYYELVAVAILGLRRHRGAPVRQSFFLIDKFHLDTAGRSEVEPSSGWPRFLGLPVAYVFGDRFFRRAPQRPLVIAGFCITAYGSSSSSPSTSPSCGCSWPSQFVATAGGGAAGHLHLHDAGGHGPARNADHLLRHVRRRTRSCSAASPVGRPRRRLRRHRRAARHRRRRSPSSPPCASLGGFLLVLGSRCVRRDITLVIEDVHRALRRGQTSPGRRGDPRLCRCTTSTSTTAPTRCSST